MLKISNVLFRIERFRLRTIFFAFVASFAGLTLSWTIFVTKEYRGGYDIDMFTRFRRLLGGPGPRNVVIILSNRRSGTTLLGEIFSHKQGGFYLFEPLLPYTTECDMLKEDRVELLTKMLDCDFSTLSRDIANALKRTGYPDGYSKCIEHNICFSNKNGRLLDNYSRLCAEKQNKTNFEIFDEKTADCGYPLKPNILSELCESASIVAYKIVRVCSLQMMEPLYQHLTKKGHRVYIIHLVRDPRAVLSSRLQLGLDGLNKTTMQRETRLLCDRYRRNIKYVKQLNIDGNMQKNSNVDNNVVSDGHYMRIRFEDFATDIVGSARKLYEFMDSDLPFEVENWIRKSRVYSGALLKQANQNNDKSLREKASQILEQMIQPFSTTRDPESVLRKWRLFLTYPVIQMIQDECGDIMYELNYDRFESYKDLINFSMRSYH